MKVVVQLEEIHRAGRSDGFPTAAHTTRSTASWPTPARPPPLRAAAHCPRSTCPRTLGAGGARCVVPADRSEPTACGCVTRRALEAEFGRPGSCVISPPTSLPGTPSKLFRFRRRASSHVTSFMEPTRLGVTPSGLVPSSLESESGERGPSHRPSARPGRHADIPPFRISPVESNFQHPKYLMQTPGRDWYLLEQPPLRDR